MDKVCMCVYVCVCACAHARVHVGGNACMQRAHVYGRQVPFFWKILEVHLQGVCSELLSPFRDTLFVFQIRGL